jgi:hypothetical protein
MARRQIGTQGYNIIVLFNSIKIVEVSEKCYY